ncbi:MAG TPA: hypothetical protein QF708_05270 [Candidatus Poseidoniia archaeon]|jgi:hypothetical protein|nr:hypothetical protein [Candidatus Poseidoniia archaeon]|tara:strand:+ start:1710 stop:2216 length:507 start_codon:yes stop_codon:yes gene_type:complete
MEHSQDVDKDYEHIRKQLYDLSLQGGEAIELMLEVARESEHPRAFEVLGQLIKNNAEIAEKLMKLQKNKKEVTNLNTIPGLEHQTNNVFIGSTAELQKMLRDEVVVKEIPDDDDSEEFMETVYKTEIGDDLETIDNGVAIGETTAWPEDDERINIIGQNGNDGLHYEK